MSLKFLGHPVDLLPSRNGAYALSVDRPVSKSEARTIAEQWCSVMGEAKLIVLPHGTTLTYIAPGMATADTPIYDSLVEELGPSVVR